jgi:hypothetical protein
MALTDPVRHDASCFCQPAIPHQQIATAIGQWTIMQQPIGEHALKLIALNGEVVPLSGEAGRRQWAQVGEANF